MKTAEEIIHELNNRKDVTWEQILNKFQSDAIESTVRKCAEIAYASKVPFVSSDTVAKNILALIPQKERKV